MTLETDIRRAAALLREAAGDSLAFTGAGMSAESGIPTFRGQGGIWEDYPPSVYGTPLGLAGTYLFRFNRFHRFLVDAANTFLDAEPNDGHRALAALERLGLLRAVVTQNVDNLHQDGGSRDVLEIHGNYLRGRCRRCGPLPSFDRQWIADFVASLRAHATGRLAFIRTVRRHGTRCPTCQSLVRPDVVLFGESLPGGVYERSMRLAESCRVLLAVGTSALVRPASDIPYAARLQGAILIEVNPEETAMTPLADLFLRGPSGDILPRVLEQVDPPQLC